MPDKLETCPACGRRAKVTFNEYEGRKLCAECAEVWDEINKENETMNTSKKREWKVGDRYKVTSSYGVVVTGIITKIDIDGYHVVWSDGQKTIEDYPDPMTPIKPR